MKNALTGTTMCLLAVLLFPAQGFGEEPLRPLTIQLDWITNVQFAGILVAKERGWYEEKGIDLTVKGWEKGVSPIDDVLAGKSDIGVAAGSLLAEAVAKGARLKALATQFQKSPLCLLGKKDKLLGKGKKEAGPENLLGKNVGVSTPKTEIMTKIVLANRGLTYEDIHPIQTGGDLDFLREDKVLAFVGFMNNQPLIMKAEGYEMTYIPAFKHGYEFYSGVYFATETMIRKEPEMIRRFLDVTLRGWKEAFNDLAASAKLVVEKYHPRGSVIHQRESLRIFKFLATLGVGEDLIGYMERPFWQRGIDILYESKQIDRRIPAEEVFTSEFLKAASPKK